MVPNDPPSNEELLADRNKLLHIIAEFERTQRWQRKRFPGTEPTDFTFQFNHRKEELYIKLHPHALEFKLTPPNAPNALSNIIKILKKFFTENPNSKMKLIVTIQKLSEHNVKTALETMLDNGLDITKIMQIKDGSGKSFPADKLNELIQQVKNRRNGPDGP